MAKKKHILAVFTFSNSVPQFINDVNAFKEALTTAPGNTRVTIAAGVITQLTTDMDALVLSQAKVKANQGTAADRDIDLDVVKADVRGLVGIVQAAADNAPDEQTSIAIIQDCGLKVKQKGVFVKPDIEVRNDKTISGLVHLISKAAPKKEKAFYEWQSSRDGVNFTPAIIDTHSRIMWQMSVAPGTKVSFRKRVTTNKTTGTPAWSQVVFVFVL